MKIAIFYPRNFLACSYALGGYYNTLTRMGHEVRDCFFPGNTVQVTAEILAKMPTMEQLLESDLVISFYHEYTQPLSIRAVGAAHGESAGARAVR